MIMKKGFLEKINENFFVRYKSDESTVTIYKTIPVYNESKFLKSEDLDFVSRTLEKIEFQVDFEKIKILDEYVAFIKGYDDDLIKLLKENNKLLELKQEIYVLKKEQEKINAKILEKKYFLESTCTHPPSFLETKNVYNPGGYDYVSECYKVTTCLICGKNFKGAVEYGTYG